MPKDKELADHERAHNGTPGMKVRHGADAVGGVKGPKNRTFYAESGNWLEGEHATPNAAGWYHGPPEGDTVGPFPSRTHARKDMKDND